MKRLLALVTPLLLLPSVQAQDLAGPFDVSVEPVLVTGEAKEGDLRSQALADRILALVQGAEKRIWLSAYTLTDPQLCAALLEKARTPTFDLRILADEPQWRCEPHQGFEDLSARGQLGLLSVPDDGRLHTKLMLIDDLTIVTGSHNWSNLAGTDKWEDMVVLHDLRGPAVKAARSFFEAVAAKAGITRLGSQIRHSKPKAPEGSEEARVVLGFTAPGSVGNGLRRQLLERIRAARTRVWLCFFLISDPEVAQAMVQKAEEGVDTRFIQDQAQFTNLGRRKDAEGQRILDLLKTLKKTEHMRTSAGGPQLHHKLAIVDDAVITGSANCTKAAWEKNYEASAILLPPNRAKEPPVFLGAYRARFEELWELGR